MASHPSWPNKGHPPMTTPKATPEMIEAGCRKFAGRLSATGNAALALADIDELEFEAAMSQAINAALAELAKDLFGPIGVLQPINEKAGHWPASTVRSVTKVIQRKYKRF